MTATTGVDVNTATRICAAPARVCRVMRPCSEHVVVEVELPSFPPSTPGQFLELRCNTSAAEHACETSWTDGDFPKLTGDIWSGRAAFLRRPFSIADRWDVAGGARLVVISRCVGPGTQWLDQLQPNDTLDLTGPLGRGFTFPSQEARIALVGGGVGIPPMLYFARELRARGHKQATMIFGALRRDLFPVTLLDEPDREGAATRCIELPGGAEYPASITSDDGSLGLRGRVTNALARWSETLGAGAAPRMVYACGPTGMLKAVSKLTRELELDCELCVERNMGCGLGTCLSCVLRVRDNTRPQGWRWALACTDGPVFARDALFDDA